MFVKVSLVNEGHRGTLSLTRMELLDQENSIVMDGHCETVSFQECTVWFQLDMALLAKVLTVWTQICPQNMLIEGGSNLAPPLCPRPWEAGAFSLNPSLSFSWLAMKLLL